MARKVMDFRVRFWNKVDRQGQDDCWPWIGLIDKDGYGIFWKDGRGKRASHIAWELDGGEIPSGYCLSPRCGNHGCVNPRHLVLKQISVPVEDRFWNKVNKGKPDQCWEWTAWKNNKGYGQIGEGGKLKLAHRISWRLVYGAIPAGMKVLHRCDNPACVNPNHLFLGSQQDNISDMMAKSRGARGKKRWNCKLTEKDVHSIRKSTLKQYKLAEIYNVCPSHISDIRNGKRWGWLV